MNSICAGSFKSTSASHPADIVGKTGTAGNDNIKTLASPSEGFEPLFLTIKTQGRFSYLGSHKDISYSYMSKNLKITFFPLNPRTQGTVLRVDMAVIICYFVTGDVYAKDCQAKK